MEESKVNDSMEIFKTKPIGVHHYMVNLENYEVTYLGVVSEEKLREELRSAEETRTYTDRGVIIIAHPTMDDMYLIDSKDGADTTAQFVSWGLREDD